MKMNKKIKISKIYFKQSNKFILNQTPKRYFFNPIEFFKKHAYTPEQKRL